MKTEKMETGKIVGSKTGLGRMLAFINQMRRSKPAGCNMDFNREKMLSILFAIFKKIGQLQYYKEAEKLLVADLDWSRNIYLPIISGLEDKLLSMLAEMYKCRIDENSIFGSEIFSAQAKKENYLYALPIKYIGSSSNHLNLIESIWLKAVSIFANPKYELEPNFEITSCDANTTNIIEISRVYCPYKFVMVSRYNDD